MCFFECSDKMCSDEIDISKVTAVIITNSEPNIVSFVTQTFGQKKHIVCFTPTINLVAGNSIKNCEGLNIINKVRLVVKFIKHWHK